MAPTAPRLEVFCGPLLVELRGRGAEAEEDPRHKPRAQVAAQPRLEEPGQRLVVRRRQGALAPQELEDDVPRCAQALARDGGEGLAWARLLDGGLPKMCRPDLFSPKVTPMANIGCVWGLLSLGGRMRGASMVGLQLEYPEARPNMGALKARVWTQQSGFPATKFAAKPILCVPIRSAGSVRPGNMASRPTSAPMKRSISQPRRTTPMADLDMDDPHDGRSGLPWTFPMTDMGMTDMDDMTLGPAMDDPQVGRPMRFLA